MTTQQCQIGIITINRNRKTDLVRTLDSVRRQTYVPRVHVVDGQSSDGSVQYLEDLVASGNFESLTFRSEADQGPYDGMNRGLRLVDCQWLLFLNGGDMLVADDAIAEASEQLRTSDASIVCFGVNVISVDWRAAIGRPVNRDLHALRKHNIIYHQGAFIRRDVLRRFGGYNLNYRFCADYDFFLGCYLAGEIIAFVQQPLASFVRDGLTSDSRLALSYYVEMMRVQRAHKLTPNFWLLAIGLGKKLLGQRLSDWVRPHVARLIRR